MTGSLNALAAIYYKTPPGNNEHMRFFDMYVEVGLNVGKVLRYTLAFKPDELHEISGHQYGLEDDTIDKK